MFVLKIKFGDTMVQEIFVSPLKMYHWFLFFPSKMILKSYTTISQNMTMFKLEKYNTYWADLKPVSPNFVAQSMTVVITTNACMHN